MGKPGVCKRTPALSKSLLLLHEKFSKALLHEALLDLWLETNGYDIHPDLMSEKMLSDYEKDIINRSELHRKRMK